MRNLEMTKNTVTPWMPTAKNEFHHTCGPRIPDATSIAWARSTVSAATARSESDNGKRGLPGGGATTAGAASPVGAPAPTALASVRSSAAGGLRAPAVVAPA
jgi:hypothetical protein